MGCFAVLLPVFTYDEIAITDSQLGYRMACYFELGAKTVALVLFDVYKNYCVWSLSRRMTTFMQKLLLKPVLGSDHNVEEFECFMNCISEMNF